MKTLRAIIIAGIFVLAQGNFLFHLVDFPFSPGSDYSDLAISHYSNATFLRQSIVEYGQIPFWSNAIMSGYPFIANPLSGIHYPPGWLALIFPLPFGFNLLVSLHLLFGAYGFYRLFKKNKINETLSVFGGVCFILIPRLWAHIAAGHLTLIYAISWTPWLLLVTGDEKSRKNLLPGFVLGMIILADVRWAGYLLVPWLAYYGYSVEVFAGKRIDFLKKTFNAAAQMILGVLIGAVLLLPLSEYTQLSSRANLTLAERSIFSLQPQQFIALLFPDFFSNTELIVYPGLLMVIAYLWSWLDPVLKRKTGFLRWCIFLTYAISLGTNSIFTGWLFGLPIFAFLRVPSRLVLVGTIFLIVLFIQWADYLFNAVTFEKVKSIRLGLVAFCGLMIIFTLLVWSFTPDVPVNLFWGCAVMVLAVVCLFFYIRHPKKWLGYCIMGLALLDLMGFNFIYVSYKPSDDVLGKNQEAAEYIAKQKGIFRIYSLSYSIPQQTAARYQIEIADGIDPLQIRNYVDFMEKAGGFKNEGYSVTLPPFATGTPETDNLGVKLNAANLGLLNVRFITSQFNIESEGLREIKAFGSTRIYENDYLLPRAWVQSGKHQTGLLNINDEDITLTPNYLTLKASGPGLLVVSEINYPGWVAQVDGKSAEIVTAHDLFRGVELGEGDHLIEMEYRPVLFYLGLLLTISSLVFLFVRNWRKSDR